VNRAPPTLVDELARALTVEREARTAEREARSAARAAVQRQAVALVELRRVGVRWTAIARHVALLRGAAVSDVPRIAAWLRQRTRRASLGLVTPCHDSLAQLGSATVSPPVHRAEPEQEGVKMAKTEKRQLLRRTVVTEVFGEPGDDADDLADEVELDEDDAEEPEEPRTERAKSAGRRH
jgi:hypothetical protein